MKLIIDGIGGLVTVEKTEDLKALSVELRGCTPEQASALLGGLGRVEGSHAWLHIGALRAFVPKPRSCSWDERFRQAMAFAEQHGWTDQTGNFVRAHIAPAPDRASASTPPPPRSDQGA